MENTSNKLPITNNQLPADKSQLPISNYQLSSVEGQDANNKYQVPNDKDQIPTSSNIPDALLTERLEPEDLDAKWTRLKCLVCGYVYEGRQAIHKCPKCGNDDPDKFEDVD